MKKNDNVTVTGGAYKGQSGFISIEIGSSFYVVFNDGGADWLQEYYLTPTKPSYATLTKGMYLTNSDGEKRKVLAIMGDLIAVSYENDFEVLRNLYLRKELQKDYWTVFGADEETIEVGGKEYNRKEYETAISNLKEIQL